MGVRHRIANWLRHVFVRAEAPVAAVLVPLVLPEWAAWATEVPVSMRVVRARPLAAQLASQARLNVPVGRKARAAGAKASVAAKPKPISRTEAKRAPVARSVHLQARHFQAKLNTSKATPIRSATVTTLPAVARATRTRPVRQAA